MDDGTVTSPSEHLISQEIKSLMKDCDLTNDGRLKDYLGIRFEHHQDGSITLTQPRMVPRILAMVGLNPDERTKTRHIQTSSIATRMPLRDNKVGITEEWSDV